MSVLLHVCRTCRHRATSHQGGDRGYSACPCCRGPGDIDPEPLLVPTWAFPHWEAEPLHRPGTQWNAGTTHRLELCACARCFARFTELTSDLPATVGTEPGRRAANQ